jgi:hypothetical protein
MDEGDSLEKGEIDVDETADVLAAQLGSLKWTRDSRGCIKIREQDDMRKRGMPSPTGLAPLPKRSHVEVRLLQSASRAITASPSLGI